MIPMMMMMMRPTARIRATRSYNQPEFADRGELPYTITGNACKTASLSGKPWIDKNGYPVTKYDDMTDAEAKTHTEQLGWQERWNLGLFFEDDICVARLGVSTTRPSATNGGYELHERYQNDMGTWRHLYMATTFKEFRPYRSATGSHRIVDHYEKDGACTITLIDQADGNREVVTATMLTDMDDVANRPTCQTGTVAMHSGTVDTTRNVTLRLAGHINEPLEQRFVVGGTASDAYDPVGMRTRWVDGKTWTIPYVGAIHKYCTNYYGIEYSEGGQLKLKAVPIYDYLTKQAGFQDEAHPMNRLIFSQGKRAFKPVWDDGIAVDTEVAG